MPATATVDSPAFWFEYPFNAPRTTRPWVAGRASSQVHFQHGA